MESVYSELFEKAFHLGELGKIGALLKERVLKLERALEDADNALLQCCLGIECPEDTEYGKELAIWKKQPDIHQAEAFLEQLAALVADDREAYALCQDDKEQAAEELAVFQAMEARLLELQRKREELEQLLQQEQVSLEEAKNEEEKRRLFFAKKAVSVVHPLREAYLAAKKEREELFRAIESKEKQLAALKAKEEAIVLHYHKAQADRAGMEELFARIERAKNEVRNATLRHSLIGQHKEKMAEYEIAAGRSLEKGKELKQLEEEYAACRRAAGRLAEIYRQGTELERREQEIKRVCSALSAQKKQLESYEATKVNYERLTALCMEKLESQRKLEREVAGFAGRGSELAALKEEVEKLSKEAAMEKGTMQVLEEYFARPREEVGLLRLTSIEECKNEEERQEGALREVMLGIEALIKEQSSCIQAKNRVPELEKKIAQERQAAGFLQEAMLRLAQERQGMESEIKKLTLALTVEDEAEAKRRLDALLAEQEKKKREIAEAEAAYFGWDNQSQNEAAVLTQLLGQKAARAKREQGAKEEYFAALKASGFDTEEEYKKAVLDAAHIKELEQAIEQREIKMLKRKERIRALTQETGRGEQEDIRTVRAKIEELGAKKEAEGKRLPILAHRIEANEAIRQQAGEQRKIKEQLQAEYGSTFALSAAANGELPGKDCLPFAQYVQALYLEQAVPLANERLKQASGGRYTLLCKVQEDSKHGVMGPCLEVMDCFTGKAESIHLLSGGEPLPAKLAMALGCTDVKKEEEHIVLDECSRR